jgi:hypothetical protein
MQQRYFKRQHFSKFLVFFIWRKKVHSTKIFTTFTKLKHTELTTRIRKTIFWIAIAFILLTMFSLTIGQIFPFEFADYQIRQKFHNTLVVGTPIAILLTLFETIEHGKIGRNFAFLGVTVLVSFASYIAIMNFLFSFCFGNWVTATTIFRHKTNGAEIKEQWKDAGAFGYRGKRIVKTQPFLKYWVLPTNVDTAKIDKNEWIFVDEQGEIKFP